MLKSPPRGKESMATLKQRRVDGIYNAFFAGVSGTSQGMFVFFRGNIAGADVANGVYDGEYTVTADGNYVEGKARFVLPPGNVSITGASATTEPISIEIPIKLPVDIQPSDVHRIETPLGPVNARFQKIRELK